MALKGIGVVELLGLAPGPFCGMLLAEFGASVTVVERITPSVPDVLGSGKRNISVNLKNEDGKKIFRDLCKSSDVLIEPFRPGVMEKNGLCPKVLMKDNPRLIYARLTGYGQNGELQNKAGHDINYVAISGILSLLGKKGTNPFPPLNFAADFAGGSVMCALGIVLALFERQSSNKGQVIDCSMVEGVSYISSWINRSKSLPIWGNPRGENLLDGGPHFYDTYLTKDGKYMAVGALEPQFYLEFMKGLGISDSNQFLDFEEKKVSISNLFKKRTQAEWCKIFDKLDACITPVLSLEEAAEHPHNISRKSFIRSHDQRMVPAPAPVLSRTPATSLAAKRLPHHGEHTKEVLTALNYSLIEIQRLHDEGIVHAHTKSNL